ncbi:MAG TPA: regulatory protein RecX [Patescibacteria group bacterium]|nr:regulatory protein RecX [Patescibacteria group bacterium]
MRKDRPPVSPRDRALGLLSRREHSARELKRKLLQKGVAAEEAGDVVGEMGDRNYQSDARFAESLVRRRALDGYGPLRIRAELASHGIVREAATAAIGSAEVDWIVIARRVFSAKFRDTDAADHKERQKRAAWLSARGFDGSVVRAVTRAEVDD